VSLIEAFGWRPELSNPGEPLHPDQSCGRVVAQFRKRWVVQLDSGVANASIAGAYAGPLPVTGDWVVTERAPHADHVSIVAVLDRYSAVSRGMAGSGLSEQVLAANIDIVWIVHPLHPPPNLRSIERYLAVAWESGAVPEVILTKSDLADDAEALVHQVECVAFGVKVRRVSVHDAARVADLRATLPPRITVALLGPSGAGKSSLINALAAADLVPTGVVREADQKGRHTTTHRELYQVPGGALLLDTPGMRELRVWDAAEGLSQTFPDILELASGCRFRDCSHRVEPGCSVLRAVAEGRLDSARLESFRKLQAEAAHEDRRVNPLAEAAAVARHKTAMKTLKYHHKYRQDQ
jgi:ribosome biogenesis GTPase / thiamine phosphate phosphatase